MMARIVLIVLFVCPALYSQGTTDGLGTLELPFAARNAALAEGIVADQTNELAALVNPSLLAGSTSPAISISHQSWIQDVKTNFLFVSLPISVVRVGVGVSTTSVGGIELREFPGPAIGTFEAQTAVLTGSVAYELAPEAAIGVSIRHVYEKIYVDESASVLFDVGALYRSPIEGLSAGIAIQHFGITDPLKEERSPLPTQTRAGLAYEMQFNNDFRFVGVFSGTFRPTGTRLRLHGGAECTYADIVSLRLGYQTGYETRGISGGLGLMYGDFSFDYGSVPFSLGLGTGHLLTLGYRF